MGEQWEKAVALWWAIEESTEFETKVRSLPTPNRPAQVGAWVKTARSKTPGVTLPTFSKEWKAWWCAINPSWRRRNGELVREGTGPWKVLRHPGPNGLLNILVCLKWWHGELETDGPNEEWNGAVEDVVWALEGIVRYIDLV
ncbi:hypothetical protein DFH07DRAFT_760629 [Mycena maculata]|uniref:Uncharacterized protein n=1 Tax=Mycena maculata TaxID=230809 RepID=A0AAD7HIZ7_9AGAR|nr:hypothetical protein DFH07DRAFT_760629 [Mycena maculata]